jgi:predicted nucleic acid-binding protein
MRGASFLDTNVLVYFAERERIRFDRAAELLEGGGAINIQVLNEFVNVSRTKFKREWQDIHEALNLIRSLTDVRPLTVDVHERALAVAERYQFHIYDAMIVAAALEAGCSTLYTEDMHSGLLVEGRLRIVNPFA